MSSSNDKEERPPSSKRRTSSSVSSYSSNSRQSGTRSSRTSHSPMNPYEELHNLALTAHNLERTHSLDVPRHLTPVPAPSVRLTRSLTDGSAALPPVGVFATHHFDEEHGLGSLHHTTAIAGHQTIKGHDQRQVDVVSASSTSVPHMSAVLTLLEETSVSTGLSSAEAEKLLGQYGRNELPDNATPKWLVFVRLLYQPMSLMIWAAALIEAAIENFPDMGVLIAINLANALLSFHETTKAGDAVAALKQSLRPVAVVHRDGEWNNQFDATLLVPGDLVELASGASVPADVMINEGQVDIDESSITGESLPVTLQQGEIAKMGSTVVRGETTATVVLTGANTFFGKTASLLKDNNEGSNIQRLLTRIVVILTVMSLSMCLVTLFYLRFGNKHETAREALSFAVVVLVASMPMAMEIVVLTTLALGSRELSKDGAIVSRLAAIEEMAGLQVMCSDKTGTLTKNKMELGPDAPSFDPTHQHTIDELLVLACLAAKWESPPKDALDRMVLRSPRWYPADWREQWERLERSSVDLARDNLDEWLDSVAAERLAQALERYEQLDYMPFDPRTKRTESCVRDKVSGRVFRVTKGAPNVLQELVRQCGNGTPVASISDKVAEYGADGVRCMSVALSKDLAEGDERSCEHDARGWRVAGLLTFLDPPRDDTKDTIERAEAYGVRVRMITGDHLLIARKVCRDLNMGDRDKPEWPHIEGPSELPMLDENGDIPADLVANYGEHIVSADGFAQVFPEHKYLIVETYRRLGFKTGMTGDGVNDAPALKRADVGIAVAGATDAARAAADIVFTREGLGTIVRGLQVSRVIFRRMRSFLTYRIGATLQLLWFFFISVFAFDPHRMLLDTICPTGYVSLDGDITGGMDYNFTYTDKLSNETFACTGPTTLGQPGSLPANGTLIDVPWSTEPQPFDLPGFVDKWPTFFHLPVLMLMIITLINDGTLISIGYDRAAAANRPEKWNLPFLFFVSGLIGAVACVSSLGMLMLMLNSWDTEGIWQSSFGLSGLSYGEIVNAMFLKIAITDILTLLSARTQEKFFFHPPFPYWLVLVACLGAVLFTTLLSLIWRGPEFDHVSLESLACLPHELEEAGVVVHCNRRLPLFVWLFAIVFFFIQDVVKVCAFHVGRFVERRVAPSVDKELKVVFENGSTGNGDENSLVEMENVD